MSNGQCVASGAFTEDGMSTNESDTSDHFWLGSAVGFTACAILGILLITVVSIWRRKRKSIGVVDSDGIKLKDDQQLNKVGNTMIELRESFEVAETKPVTSTQ